MYLMNGVDIDLDKKQGSGILQTVTIPKPKTSFLLGFLTSIGITDPALANIILLGIAGLFFGVAIFISAGSTEKKSAALSADQVAAQMRVFNEMKNPKK